MELWRRILWSVIHISLIISYLILCNCQVKSCSETALVDVLLMRKGPQGQNQALSLLDSGARDTMNDIISKSLIKLATQPEGKEMVLDDTLLL